MHIAKCEGCGKEIEFETYKHDWPKGWIQTGMSRWGNKYHRQGGYGWWCPECNKHEPTKAAEPITLQGYSYPPIPLTDVIAYEARQGREVGVAVQHAGGWVVTERAHGEVLKALANLYAYYYDVDEDSVQISPETKEALDTLMEIYDQSRDMAE